MSVVARSEDMWCAVLAAALPEEIPESGYLDMRDVTRIAYRLLQERDRAQKLAKANYRHAKRLHSEKWGQENADIAYRDIEEADPWLLEKGR